MLVNRGKNWRQIVITEKVVNYPGIYEISGAELTGIMKNRGHVSERSILKPRFCHFVLIRILRLLIRDKGVFYAFSILIATGHIRE